METSDDVPMPDTDIVPEMPKFRGGYSKLLRTPHSDAFAFSKTETLALELYDQLRELELQINLFKAQDMNHVPDVSNLSDDEVQEQLVTAQRELVDAKAKFEIRNKITHNVLMVNPVLKAVHGGDITDFAEKRILPLITENDALSMVHGLINTRLLSVTRDLTVAEQSNIDANRENRERSKYLLALAEETRALTADEIVDTRLRKQVELVEKEAKESRRKMLNVKGILSTMIVGSGINWTADETLQDLVLDDEDDEQA